MSSQKSAAPTHAPAATSAATPSSAPAPAPEPSATTGGSWWSSLFSGSNGTAQTVKHNTHEVVTGTGVTALEIEVDGDWRTPHLSGAVACIIKRLVLIGPILIITINTLSGVYNITNSITSKSPHNYDLYDEDVYFAFTLGRTVNDVFSAGSPNRVYSCEEDYGLRYIKYSCDFTQQTPFIAMISIWAVWCLLMAAASLIYTASYSPNDFRFFVAAEAFRTTLTNHILCICGFLLTVVSFLVGFYYASEGDNSENVGPEFYLSLFIFVVLNFSALMSLYKRDFDINMDEWKDEILVVPVRAEEKKITNLYGSLVTSNGIIMKLESCLICELIGSGTKEDQSVEKYGDLKELTAAFKKLGGRKTQISANLLQA